jgi:hypothetical protein
VAGPVKLPGIRDIFTLHNQLLTPATLAFYIATRSEETMNIDDDMLIRIFFSDCFLNIVPGHASHYTFRQSVR